MKQLIIVPDGRPCHLAECPPGYFMYEDTLCFKTKYRTDENRIMAYDEEGEFFCHGDSDHDRDYAIVQPVKAEWREDEH